MKKTILSLLILISIQSISHELKGVVSFYGRTEHGKKTARGDIFNKYAMTAAHKTLPFGTMLKVTNKANNKSVVVKITDRGPFIKGRILDLSESSFLKIANKKQGLIKKDDVKIEIFKLGNGATCHVKATKNNCK